MTTFQEVAIGIASAILGVIAWGEIAEYRWRRKRSWTRGRQK